MDNLDRQVLEQARDWVASGRAVWLVTVLETWGSAPRPPGALLAMRDDGLVVGFPETVKKALSEEHGVIDISACDDRFPAIGEKIRIIPNHTCVVTNMFDTMVNGVLTGIEDVAARSLVK